MARHGRRQSKLEDKVWFGGGARGRDGEKGDEKGHNKAERKAKKLVFDQKRALCEEIGAALQNEKSIDTR